MKDKVETSDPEACVKKSCLMKEKDTYMVEAAKASVAADSSVTLYRDIATNSQET